MERDAGLAAIPARAGWSRRSACRSGWVCVRLPAWLGDGSLSLVAHLAGGPGRLVADKFDLTAAALQASGDLAVDRSGVEPRLTGHVRSEALTLPLPNGGSDVPLPLGALHGWRGDVQLGIGELAVGTGPVVHDASMALSVADGALRLERFHCAAGLRNCVRQPRIQCRCRSAFACGAGQAARCACHRPAGRCADRSAVGPRRRQRAARSERL